MRRNFSGSRLEGRDYFNDGVLYYRGLVQARITAAKKKDDTAEGGKPEATSLQDAYAPY